MTRARRASAVVRTCATAALGVLASVAVLVGTVATAPPAEATTYRYWTYWSGERPGSSATWTFSSRGPATDITKDGTVVGWRFAITTRAGDGSDKPRQSPALATVCPSLAEPVAGRTRVALVIDYGTEAAAPPGQKPPLSGSVRVECLELPTTGRVTGADVLREADVEPRVEDGLVCALDGYPTGECAPVVDGPTRPTATPSRTPTRSPSARPSSAQPTRSAAPGRSSAGSPASAAPSTAAVSPAPSGPSSSASPAGVTSVEPDPSATGAEPEALPAVSGAPVSSGTSSGSALGFVGGALLVGGVAGAAWWSARRRGGAR